MRISLFLAALLTLVAAPAFSQETAVASNPFRGEWETRNPYGFGIEMNLREDPAAPHDRMVGEGTMYSEEGPKPFVITIGFYSPDVPGDIDGALLRLDSMSGDPLAKVVVIAEPGDSGPDIIEGRVTFGDGGELDQTFYRK